MAIAVSAAAQRVPSPGGHGSTVLTSNQRWTPRRPLRLPGTNGAAVIRGSISGATIGPARIEGAYRAVESARESEVRRLRITGLIAAGLERDGIRLRQADEVDIGGFDLSMRAEPQVRPHLPQGIAIVRGTNISIHDGRVAGFRMARVEGKYTNGDGIALEGGVSNVTIARVIAENNSDGGFDLKSRDTRLQDTVARNNSRNYRFWGTGTATTITSESARSAHVWLGRGANWRISRLVVRSTTLAPIVRVEARDAVLVIDRCDLDVPAGTPLIVGHGQVTLGLGCATRR
jgi:hypothetical protein